MMMRMHAPIEASASTSVTLDEFVEAAKALGHPGRLRSGDASGRRALRLPDYVGPRSSGSTVSAHLSDLRRAGLVAEQKRGKWVHYRLTEGDSFRGLVREGPCA